MKMIDDQRKQSVKSLSLFLTTREAREMRDNLEHLLADPESNEHFHVYSDDNSREISCSVITESKLKNLKNYNKLEQQVLSEE
jgi:hypothetical protein